jgi:hypothetical protein
MAAATALGRDGAVLASGARFLLPTAAMDDFDLAHRELCPDGSCIGVIGPDGRCKVCGSVSPNAVSDPRNQGLRPVDADGRPRDPADADDDSPRTDDDSPRTDGDAAADPSDPDDEFARRQLCPDGGCIGVIGSDGRCKECGKPAGSAPP